MLREAALLANMTVFLGRADCEQMRRGSGSIHQHRGDA